MVLDTFGITSNLFRKAYGRPEFRISGISRLHRRRSSRGRFALRLGHNLVKSTSERKITHVDVTILISVPVCKIRDRLACGRPITWLVQTQQAMNYKTGSRTCISPSRSFNSSRKIHGRNLRHGNILVILPWIRRFGPFLPRQYQDEVKSQRRPREWYQKSPQALPFGGERLLLV